MESKLNGDRSFSPSILPFHLRWKQYHANAKFSWIQLGHIDIIPRKSKIFFNIGDNFSETIFFHGINMTFVDLDIFAKSLQKVIAKLSRNCGEL
jgi:hypothetical protein